MHRNFPPPNPNFSTDTVYGAYGRIDTNHSTPDKAMPRIARNVGGAAMKGILPIGPGFLESVAKKVAAEREQVQEQAQIRRTELYSAVDPQGKDAYGHSLRERTTTTPESEAEAALVYRYADNRIKDIVNPYRPQGVYLEEHMAELIRSNDELRIELGTFFEQRFEEIDADPNHFSLPRALWKHTNQEGKNINFPGYAIKPSNGPMTNREGAILFALAKLDGTFKSDYNKSMGVAKDRRGEYSDGQRREGADILLGINGKIPKPWNLG